MESGGISWCDAIVVGAVPFALFLVLGPSMTQPSLAKMNTENLGHSEPNSRPENGQFSSGRTCPVSQDHKA